MYADGLEPPQLVVIGGESSGKSSLLERITMMPIFPQDIERCTRVPVRVFMRRGVISKVAKLIVRNLKTRAEVIEWFIPIDAGRCL